MKTVIIILLMLYSYFLLLGHQQEMHQHITRESFQLLKYSFPQGFTGLDEMEAYLGSEETENQEEDAVLFNSVGALKIVAGSWFEDEYDMVYHYGTYRIPDYNETPPWFEELLFTEEYNRAAHTTITHFWDADEGENASTHLEDTIEFLEFSLNWEFTISKNALKKIRKYINGDYEARWIYSEAVDWGNYGSCLANDFNIPPLIDLYHGNGALEATSSLIEGESDWQDVTSPVLDFPDTIRKGIVYNLLGRMCHLLQDMSVPAHAHCTSHAGIYEMYSDIFESNELEYLNEVEDWTAFEVYQQYGELIDPYDHEDPVFYLAYFLNQIADYFPDGRQAGDENYDPAIPGLEEVISSLDNQLEPNDLNAGNCIDMYNVLIPYAIKATAGLLYWFAVESGQIEPIPEPWYVSGTVGTSDAAVPDEITVHFDKLNSEHDFTINADENGFFSRLFCYRESGSYNIEIRKDGYYPAVFSNLNINTELDLGIVTLEPVQSQNYVLVSQDTDIAAFRNLRGAIEFLQNRSGGTIYVQPGVYCGERNRELSWIPLNTVDLQEECHIRIRAFEPHTAVIDCENLGSAFVFDAEGLHESYTDEDEISGLIIQNSPQAIRIHNGHPVITDNIIENCTIPQGLENAHGTGLFCLSGALIENNIFRNNTGNWNGDDVSTYTYGGAIYLNNETSDPIIFRNNQIFNCSAQEGGAVYCQGSGSLEISGNLVSGNTLITGAGYNNHQGDCEGIFCTGCYDLLLQGNTVIQNQHSEVNGGSALFIANSENAVIRNNTISNNDALIGVRLLNNSNCELYNNLITGNGYGIYCWGPMPTVEFCNVWNNQSGNYSGDVLPGESCLSKDPKFIDPSANNYYLEWSQHAMSPCIDKGCVWINDLDGTPSDLGSNPTFWHDHHVTVLGETVPRIRYRWVSFPVLDRDITLNASYPGDVMLPLTETGIDEIKILSETDFLEWNGSTWQGGIEEFESAAGYKIKTIGNHQLGISGYRIAADTAIHLEPYAKKWIGYFATEPQSVFTALASIWDNLLSIASEDWLYVKDGAYPSERCCLLPGKMYIIEVSESCDLIYTQSDVPVVVRERELTENFSYQESPEYAAFVIDQINDPDISEIGLYLDDECIGAAVVDDFPMQLLAFLPENTRGNGELNFSFFSNNRNYCQPQEVLYRTDNNSEYIKNQPLLESGKMISVKFDDDYIPSTEFGLEGNHPNPFNPQTSIEYSIPEKGKVMLHIYNLKGQCIRTLVNGIQDPGVYNILWDGRDDQGKETSSGIYFYRLILGQATDTRKMILLK